MSATTPIAYATDTGIWCLGCIAKAGLDKPDSVDQGGNPIHPIFSHNGHGSDLVCGGCLGPIRRQGNSVDNLCGIPAERINTLIRQCRAITALLPAATTMNESGIIVRFTPVAGLEIGVIASWAENGSVGVSTEVAVVGLGNPLSLTTNEAALVTRVFAAANLVARHIECYFR